MSADLIPDHRLEITESQFDRISTSKYLITNFLLLIFSFERSTKDFNYVKNSKIRNAYLREFYGLSKLLLKMKSLKW